MFGLRLPFTSDAGNPTAERDWGQSRGLSSLSAPRLQHRRIASYPRAAVRPDNTCNAMPALTCSRQMSRPSSVTFPTIRRYRSCLDHSTVTTLSNTTCDRFCPLLVPESLALFRRIDTLKADSVILIRGIEHGNRIAIAPAASPGNNLNSRQAVPS